MNNKGVAKISTYLIALVVVGMVFSGLLGMMQIANTESATFLTGEEDQEFTNLESHFGEFLNNTIEDNTQFEDSMNSTTQPGEFGFLDTLVNSGFSTLKNIWSSFGIVSLVLNNIDSWGLPIPSWVGAALLSMIVILIAFGIYRFIFKVDG